MINNDNFSNGGVCVSQADKPSRCPIEHIHPKMYWVYDEYRMEKVMRREQAL